MRCYLQLGSIVLALVLLPACSTTSRSVGSAKKSDAASLKGKATNSPEMLSEAELEKRIQAYSRYAAGLSYDLNDKPDLALEEYMQSVLADPSYEPLVFEVAGKLIRGQKAERAVELLTKAAEAPNASGTVYAWLGLAYNQMGKSELAIAANRSAIKRMPQSLPAYQNLAHIFLQNQKTNEALQVLDEAGKQPSVDARFLVELAEIYSRLGRINALKKESANARAKQVLDRAAKLKPAHPMILQKLGDGYFSTGEWAKAEEIYLQLIEKYPDLPTLRRRLTEVYLAADQKTKAIEQLQAIAKEDPTNPRTHSILGALALEENKLAEAAESFKRALLLNPDFEPIYYDLAGVKLNLDKPEEALEVLEKARSKFKLSFMLEFYSAIACAQQKKYAEALKRFTSAELLAKANEPQRLNHRFYYQLGSAHERNGNREDAEKAFQKCLELAPDGPEVYYDLVGLKLNLNKPEEALELIAKVPGKFKQSFMIEFCSGIARVLQKKYPEAIHHFTVAESLAKTDEPKRLNLGFYYQLGSSCERAGKHEDAEKAFRKCLELAPDSADAMNYLGYMWAELGIKLDEARVLTEKAVKLEPKNAAFLDSLGWVLFKLNQPKEALPYLLQAIEHSDKPDATLLDHLGDIYSALKEHDQAREAWRKALQVEPNEKIEQKLGAATKPERSAP